MSQTGSWVDVEQRDDEPEESSDTNQTQTLLTPRLVSRETREGKAVLLLS